MTPLKVQQLVVRPRGAPGGPISFDVAAGQVAALFGRPGSGIRTILRTLAGLEAVGGGEVRLGDVPVHQLPPHRRHIALVQRDSTLFPGTVEDNVAFGLKRAGWPKSDRNRRVAEVLELAGMTGAERDRVDILTESERARVILARAIAPKPSALLVESPTWFVPEVDRIVFRGRLREVFQSLEIPIVISTHDVQDAVGIADQLLVVHEGELRQAGSVSRVLAGPRSIEVAELVGYVTLIRGQVEDGWILEPGAGVINIPPGFPLQGTARALAHPAVMLGVPEQSGLGCGVFGTLERVRAIGPTHLLDLRIAGRTIEVRWEWDLNPPAPSDVISVAVTPGTLRFFNEPSVRRPAASVENDEYTEEAVGESEAGFRSPAGVAAAPLTESAEERWEPEPGAESSAGSTWERPQAAPVFTPSPGLMADTAPLDEPAPVVFESWEPRTDGDEVFAADGPPAPAPTPPRAPRAPTSVAPTSLNTPGERTDASQEAMAPWLHVSHPPHDDDPPKAPDPHRGMPLD